MTWPIVVVVRRTFGSTITVLQKVAKPFDLHPIVRQRAPQQKLSVRAQDLPILLEQHWCLPRLVFPRQKLTTTVATVLLLMTQCETCVVVVDVVVVPVVNDVVVGGVDARATPTRVSGLLVVRVTTPAPVVGSSGIHRRSFVGSLPLAEYTKHTQTGKLEVREKLGTGPSTLFRKKKMKR